MRVSAVAVALLLGAAVAAAGVRAISGVFTVRQNTHGDAQIVVVNPADGSFSGKSAMTFNFIFPYVETTVDPVNGVAYLVWIDSAHGVTYLYALNGRNTFLPLVGVWNMTGHFFFDLQYNSAQQTLYGIDVVSTYGRTLSNFTFAADDSVAINHLVQMPMDWYVNASSFDPATSRYFALLNNFPGLPNATVAQKFVVADFAQPVTPPNPAPDEVFDLQPHDGTFVYHFIAWNAVEGTVYGLATGPSQVQPGAQSTWLATIDPGSGATELVAPVETLETGPTWPGPLLVDPNSGSVYAYVKAHNSGIWSFVGLSGGVQIIANYDAEWAFRAATFAAW